YAQTLEHWLSRYEDHVPEVQARYGHAFVRAWRLYLAGSIASFSTGWLQLYQVLFQRAQDNDVPWTRAYMYSYGATTHSEPHAHTRNQKTEQSKLLAL
ncbi:MAG: class I SAM-dependent methyltransferase, partial [Gammaproteobacteria bacterium]